MTQTGVATLHDLLGGALPGRIHLLAGGPGSGKTSACFQFLRTGMLHGERAALLTLDRAWDLQSHASYLGHDLRASVRDGRITLVRYEARFGERLAAAASPSALVADLRRTFEIAQLRQMAIDEAPLRIAIDPLSPFLSDGRATGAALGALVDWLEETGATALVTWNGDIASADRRLERLIESAAVIVTFARLGAGRFRADVVRARHEMVNTPPIDFEIRRGFGLAPAAVSEAASSQPSIPTSVLLGPLVPMAGDRMRSDETGQAPS